MMKATPFSPPLPSHSTTIRRFKPNRKSGGLPNPTSSLLSPKAAPSPCLPSCWADSILLAVKEENHIFVFVPLSEMELLNG